MSLKYLLDIHYSETTKVCMLMQTHNLKKNLEGIKNVKQMSSKDSNYQVDACIQQLNVLPLSCTSETDVLTSVHISDMRKYDSIYNVCMYG